MPKLSKRVQANQEGLDPKASYPLADAIKMLKGMKQPKFDQTFELCLHLGLDTRQADQALRGAIALPHGVGKSKKVIAFCPADQIDACKEAGAIEAGGEELVKKIEDGWMDFDVATATPDMMRVIAKLGRTLGPKGLMPSPKAGTVTKDIAVAVKEYAGGKIEYRADSGGNIHAPIGRASFDDQKLEENAQTLISHIVKIKPSSAKGQYVKRITVSATQLPGLCVEHAN